MKPVDIFGIIVRVIGLIAVLVGLGYGLSAAILALKIAGGEGYSIWHYCVSAFLCLLVGLYLLRGAPLLVRYAYPEKEESK